ncbi:MAG: hypothetical protein ACR2IA_03025 [Pyrinomonadaceae bacterium]
MEIKSWNTYKKDNGIKKDTNILKLRDKGFVKLPYVMKKSTDETKPKDLVSKSVAGLDYDLVVFHYNDTPFEKGGSISIFAIKL